MSASLAMITVIAIAATGLNDGNDIPYGISTWPERFGNHRAVVHVEEGADAVEVRIPWRRTDEHPENKDLLVVRDGEEEPLANRFVRECNREYGHVVFEAKEPGDYYVYYMPYRPKREMGFGAETYTAFTNTADAKWIRRHGLDGEKKPHRLPAAVVSQFQARGEFNRFDPMEIAATRAETEALLAQSPDQPYLLFPEDRRNPIRMRNDLPLSWIRQGPRATMEAQAQRNEFYAFQVGVFAARQALTDVRVACSDLVASDNSVISASLFRCFNLGGVDWTGKAFTTRVNVPQGQVQPMWCGIAIPENAQPGDYTGTVTVSTADAPPASIAVRLTVDATLLDDSGDGDLWRHARLRWLDSTLGLDDDVVAPYTPLEISGKTVACLGRDVTPANGGLPSSIRSNGQEILAAPMTFHVMDNAGPVEWTSSPVSFAHHSAGKVVWEANSETAAFSMRLTCRMEFDGYLNLSIGLTAKQAAPVQDIRLAIPMRKEAATFMMGMGRKGGFRPDTWEWHWDKAKHQDSLWLGSVTAGLQCKLKGPAYSWPLVNIHYKRKPLDIPEAWNNGGNGGCQVREEGDAVVITAYSGPREMAQGETLQFNAGLLITPVKPIQYAEHWKTRYYHAYEPVENAAKAGATVINIHHANDINPYINYPFLSVDQMAAYARQAHDAGMKMKIYYTLREISNHMAELWAIRSLGTEVFADGPGGGYSWLQEHLRTGYVPAWQHFFPNGDVDASIVTQGLSRWHNYYLEGLRFLIAHADIDGLYLDDVGFDRDVMQRARKIMDRTKSGCLIDLHSWNHFNDIAGFANCANLYLEHFPYVDSIWFGEGFDYNETPDYWLVEISGIPFGMMSEMLQDGGNPWRGMIYGMTNRLPWCGDPRPIWKLWDEFAIQDARMLGYWDPACPVKTDHKDVLVTVYQKPGETLLAIASWAKEPVSVQLVGDWKSLGFAPHTVTLRAPEIAGLQQERILSLNEPLTLEPGKGMLLIVSEKGQ